LSSRGEVERSKNTPTEVLTNSSNQGAKCRAHVNDSRDTSDNGDDVKEVKVPSRTTTAHECSGEYFHIVLQDKMIFKRQIILDISKLGRDEEIFRTLNSEYRKHRSIWRAWLFTKKLILVKVRYVILSL